MVKRIILSFLSLSMIILPAFASFGEQTIKAIPTVYIKMKAYLLTEEDMAGYQLSIAGLYAWSTNKKDGKYSRAEPGPSQIWKSTKVSELMMNYGQCETPEEALESATLTMKSAKLPYREAALSWQKEDDKSWTASTPEKEAIMFVRDKFVVEGRIAVDLEQYRPDNAAELEQTLLKVLGKIESAAAAKPK